MNKFKSCVAVVTGAGSGIGKQLALQLADAGAKLAISDIKTDLLKETEDELKAKGTEVFSKVLDVAQEKDVFDYAKEANDYFGTINVVINNAGVSLASGPLWHTPIEDFKWLMKINLDGVISGTYAFLPYLEQAKWGHVVNISSIFGIIAVPNQTSYHAAKFAVRGFTESLRQELKVANSHISATSIHPGGIKTNIVNFAKVSDNGIDGADERHKNAAVAFDQFARTTAESAAEQILNAVLKDKYRLLIGIDAKIIDWVQRLFPTKYPIILDLFISKDNDVRMNT